MNTLLKDNGMKKYKVLTVKVLLFAVLFFGFDYCISVFLTHGLFKYYGLDKPAKVLLVGHSHTMLGLDKLKMEEKLGCNVAKYAIEGANVMDRFTMIRHFVNQNADSLKVITYDVDAWFLTVEGLSLNSYLLFYPFMDDEFIDRHVKNGAKTSSDGKDAIVRYYIKKYIRSSRFTDLNINGALRGYLGFYDNIKIGTVDVEAYKKRVASGDYLSISFDDGYRKVFEEMLRYTAEKNINLVLLGIPTIGILNRAEPEKFDEAMSLLQTYADKYDNISFINYNPELQDEYDLFYDPVHLGPKGNVVVTDMVINDLQRRHLLE